jgi:hypothetical protein
VTSVGREGEEAAAGGEATAMGAGSARARGRGQRGPRGASGGIREGCCAGSGIRGW